MRAPTTPAERRAMEQAYASSDPFAVARHERPGCRYLRFVDQRTRGSFGFSFVVAVPPESAQFELLPEDQTVTLEDRVPDAPAITASAEPGA